MDVAASLDAPCPPSVVAPWVDDLERYPAWLSIVTRAEPVEPHGTAPAWSVDLRGHIGPLARSKRLRMVRTVHEPERLVVFERSEGDGRQHAPWVLRAELTPTPAGSHLTMHLHYGGSFWGPVLERLLRDEIVQGSQRLLALVTCPPG